MNNDNNKNHLTEEKCSEILYNEVSEKFPKLQETFGTETELIEDFALELYEYSIEQTQNYEKALNLTKADENLSESEKEQLLSSHKVKIKEQFHNYFQNIKNKLFENIEEILNIGKISGDKRITYIDSKKEEFFQEAKEKYGNFTDIEPELEKVFQDFSPFLRKIFDTKEQEKYQEKQQKQAETYKQGKLFLQEEIDNLEKKYEMIYAPKEDAVKKDFLIQLEKSIPMYKKHPVISHIHVSVMSEYVDLATEKLKKEKLVPLYEDFLKTYDSITEEKKGEYYRELQETGVLFPDTKVRDAIQTNLEIQQDNEINDILLQLEQDIIQIFGEERNLQLANKKKTPKILENKNSIPSYFSVSLIGIQKDIFKELQEQFPELSKIDKIAINEIIKTHFQSISALYAKYNLLLFQAIENYHHKYFLIDYEKKMQVKYQEELDEELVIEKVLLSIEIHEVIYPKVKFYRTKIINRGIFELQNFVLDNYGEEMTPDVSNNLEPFYEAYAKDFQDIADALVEKEKKLDQKFFFKNDEHDRMLGEINHKVATLVTELYEEAIKKLDNFFQKGISLF